MKKLLLLLTLFATQFTVLQISQITAQAEDFSNEEDKEEMLEDLEEALLGNKSEIVKDLLNKVSFKNIRELGFSIKAELLNYLIKHGSSESSRRNKYVELFNKILDDIGLQLNFNTIKILADRAKDYHQNEMLSALHNLVGSDYF